MSTANRRRRQLKRNPSRFFNALFADSPLQRILRKKTARRLGCQPHQILDPKYTIITEPLYYGVDPALPGSEVTVKGIAYLDHDGVHFDGYE